MKLNVKSLAVSTAFIAGLLMLILSIWNIITVDFGKQSILLFEELHPSGSISIVHSAELSGKIIGLLVNTLWAVIDGIIVGFLFGMTYNFSLKIFTKKSKNTIGK